MPPQTFDATTALMSTMFTSCCLTLAVSPAVPVVCLLRLQVSLVGSASTFTGLIIALCCVVAVAFILSLIAGFRANTWLMKALDADKDGKVSRKDLYQSLRKLLHHGPKDPGSPSGKSATGASSSISSSRSSVWKGAVLLFSKRRVAAAQADEGAVQDTDTGDDGAAQDQARPGSAAASPSSARALPLGRSNLVANSLPIAHAAAAGTSMRAAARAAGADGEGGVPTSSSIDMGMLAMLRQMHGAGSTCDSAAGPADSNEAEGARLQAQNFVAVDLGQFTNRTVLQREREQTSQGGRHHAVSMGRANSERAPGTSGARMPLHAYMSVQQWLEQSEELGHGPRHPDAAGGQDLASLSSVRPDGSRVRSTAGRSRSLQLSASTPAPQMAALRSSSGSLALQRQQFLQQLQQQQPYTAADDVQHDHGISQPPGGVDLATLRSVSESEGGVPGQQQRQQQRRRATGPAAAARARDLAAAAPGQGDAEAGAAGAQQPPGLSARHQPYYALWSNIASAITGPAGSMDSTAASPGRPPAAGSSSRSSSERQQSSQSSGRRGVAAASSSITRSSAGTRGMQSSGFVTGSIGSNHSSSRVRPSPFAAAAVGPVAAGPGPVKSAGVRQSPFAAAVAASPRGAIPAPRAASAPDCHAAAAALAATAVGAPSVSKGRHSSYYSMWQAAIAEVSQDDPAAAAAEGANSGPAAQQSAGPGITAQPAATAPPVVLEPRRHKQYIGLWSGLAEELGDGPSAVGAATPGPVVPSQVAAAFAAALASPASTATAPQLSSRASSSSISHHQPGQQQQQLAGRVRPSPFATMSAAAAVIGVQQVGVAAAPAAQAPPVQQDEQRQRRRPRRPGRRPRDSAGTCLGSDSD